MTWTRLDTSQKTAPEKKNQFCCKGIVPSSRSRAQLVPMITTLKKQKKSFDQTKLISTELINRHS